MKLDLKVFVAILLFFQINLVFSDGSKDLYPSGVRGGRAFLESRTYSNGILTHQYYNSARHFAYVKQGEVLALGSSAQGIGEGTIRVISPSGILRTSGSGDVGRIVGAGGMTNRQAELAGPRNGYTPYELDVDEEGIWIIEFTTPDSLRNNNNIPNVYADDEWFQPNNQNLIAAWDVSVRSMDDAQWLQGRVFVNVLNLHMNGGNMSDINRSFFGINYVLTKDGYYYRVDGNGSIGLKFTYFVNNSGVLDANNSPSYKSSTQGYFARLHDPNSSDIGNSFVTHKIFYTIPNLDLPRNSSSALGATWLLNTTQIPNVSNIQIEASENTNRNINTKGSKITFETNYAGRYKVIIKTDNSLFNFPQREIIVDAKVGKNEFLWDAKDASGNLVPVGEYDIKVSIASIEGEVHFPYFDMEINPNGLKLERLDPLTNDLTPAILYWDDSEIPRGNFPSEHSNPIVNLSGIPSDQNGHRWGTFSTTSGGNVNNNLFTGSNSFGNNMAMDTWSYAVQIEESIEKNIVVEVADLEVVSVFANKDTIELNERVIYTVQVRNNGPSDVIDGKFEYQLPLGFRIEEISFEGNDCASQRNEIISGNSLVTTLNIKNGCDARFKLRAFASNVSDATYGYVPAEAGVVRPIGFTDPDATLINFAVAQPKTAREECSPEGCNNIKINNDVFLLEPFNERGQIAVVKSARHIDQNQSGFQEEGEIIEYMFDIKNIGLVDVKNLVILDSLITRDTIFIRDVVISKNQEHQIVLPYTITATDAKNGFVRNQARIIGKNPRNFDVKDISGTEYSNNDPTIIDIDKRPLFQLKKSVVNAGTGENNQFTIGDLIRYRFEVKHEGNIGLAGVKLIDNLLFSSDHRFLVNLISNQVLTFEFDYEIISEDIQRGFVENSAVVESIDVKYQNVVRDMSGNTFTDDNKTITQLAKPPRAISDFIEVYQGQVVNLKILDNDAEGSSKWDRGKVEIIDHPVMGKLDVNGVNVVYTQYDNFKSGADFFTYRIHDNSRLTSDVVRVDIMILKTVPVAVDDYIVQYYNSDVKINPGKNDYVEYSALDMESITIINQPVNGRLVNLGNGSFQYESNKTFSGIDEFTYRIMDTNGNWSDPATVKIEISGVLIPNVITPNGDGLNDVFTIIGLYQFEKVELQVFDRFKNMIYENTDYQNNWQVSSIVRDGTYFYVLKMYKTGEKPIIKKGSLLITRKLLY